MTDYDFILSIPGNRTSILGKGDISQLIYFRHDWTLANLIGNFKTGF